MTWRLPDIDGLEFETAPAVARRRLLVAGTDEEEEVDEISDERPVPLARRINRPVGGFRETELEPDPNANTSSPFKLAARALLPSPVEEESRSVGGAALSGPARGMAALLEKLGAESSAAAYKKGAERQQRIGEEIGSFLAPSALDLIPFAGKTDEAAAVVKKAGPGVKKLLSQEAGSVRLSGGDDLESLLSQSVDMLKKGPDEAKAAFKANADTEAGLIKAEQAQSAEFYRETEKLAKRTAGMSGEDVKVTRGKARERVREIVRKGLERASEESGSVRLMDDAEIRETTGLAKTVLQNVMSLPGEMIALKSSLSPPLLRQGRARLVTNPIAAGKELIQSLKAGASDDVARAIDDGIRSDPWIRSTEKLGGPTTLDETVKAGATMTGQAANKGYTWEDVGGTILKWGDEATEDTRVEERVMTTDTAVTRLIRGKGPIKASDRQAATELNLHRTNWYRAVAANMWQAGEKDVGQYRKLREFVEHVTQRGGWKQPGKVPLFFSTRAQSGRAMAWWDIMREVPYGVVTGRIAKPGVQQEAAKALVGMTAANMAYLGGLSALGWGTIDVAGGLPTLKGVPDHLDPWAGWNQQAKLVVGIGKDIIENYGDALEQGGWENIPQNFAQDVADRILRYGRGGLSPAFGTGTAVLTGKDYLGRDYNLMDEFPFGLLADWTAPFQVEQIAEAYREGGLESVLKTAPLATLSESVASYRSVGDVRDEQAAGLAGQVSPVTQETYPEGVTFDQLSPSDQARVNLSDAVKAKQGESPSDYQQAVERELAPSRQRLADAEAAFQRADLIKPLPDVWRDELKTQRDKKETLVNEYLKDFKGDKDSFRKLIDGYFNQEAVRGGVVDNDATEALRLKFMESKSTEEQAQVKDYFKATRLDDSSLRQNYLDYIDRKKEAGYFELDPDEKGYTGKLEALDRKNPNLDAENWYWKGGVDGKGGPALQSAEAVKLALQKAPSRPVKFAGIARPVNENEGTLGAWQEYGERAARFLSGSQVERDKEKVSLAKYKKGWDALTDSQKTSVTSHIRSGVLESAPDLEAYLAWMGQRDTITNKKKKAIETLRYLRSTYGREPGRESDPIRYHD